jgi:pSer/pThr/pTyr-binding forkhead associated (FHA) protein
MPEQTKTAKNRNSIEWLLRGVLTKIGDTFDRLTGRRYQPSSSLATSELSEKLKTLLDLEVKDGKFVPHNIKLKMQWDKFSTDSDEALKKLENELKIAVIDHINDNRYHTYAPIKLQVKPDYFTEGVKLLASFDKFDEEEREVAVSVTVPQITVGDYTIPPELIAEDKIETYLANFTVNGKAKQIELTFKEKQRRAVGRGAENDIAVDDASVSKMHAAFVLNSDKKLMVADTGSTNGTFINNSRIAYGKAFVVNDGDIVKFGNIEVSLEYVPHENEEEMMATEAFSADEISAQTVSENQKRTETIQSQSQIETVSFNSNQNLPSAEKIAVKPKVENIEIIKKIEEPQPTEKNNSETQNNPAETQDRIVFDFENEKKE